MYIRSAWLMAWAVSTASATPVELTHQGRLLDAAGMPVNGDDTPLTFDVHETGPVSYTHLTLPTICSV